MSGTPTPVPSGPGFLSKILGDPTIAAALIALCGIIALRKLFPKLDEPVFRREARLKAMAPSSSTEPRPITESVLKEANGENGKPLYIAVKDPHSDKISVFDVSSGQDFYGPGCGYHVFAGRNATYGLATTCLDPQKQDGDINTLTQSQKDTHVQWYDKYISKYPVVGFLVSDVSGNGSSQEQETKKAV